MIKIVLMTVVILLAIAGLCELLHSIRLFFVLPERRYYNYSVIHLKCGKAVRQLRSAVIQQKWLGVCYSEYVVAVYDATLTDNELEICREVAKSANAVLCPIKYVKEAIESISDDTF